MPRTVLDEARLHPAIRERVATLNADIVHNVQAASMSNPVRLSLCVWIVMVCLLHR